MGGKFEKSFPQGCSHAASEGQSYFSFAAASAIMEAAEHCAAAAPPAGGFVCDCLYGRHL